jgi:hypothetical protein
MEQPPGFASRNADRFVCKLKKSIYGLKQAGRNWNNHLHGILTKLGFAQSVKDACVYVRPGVIIAVYVDDFLLVGTRAPVEQAKKELSDCMQIKDLGDVTNLLSMAIERPSRGELIVNQQSYVDEILEEFSMSDCRSLSTPLEVGVMNVDRCVSDTFDQHTYRKAVGCLLYVAGNTRADIANAVCLVSQFCENPVKGDWVNVKHILQYLKGTKGYSLNYQKTGKPVQVYTDSDWANNKVDAKSISGYVFILAGAAICWRSKKQRCVATSSTHAEYVAMYECVTEYEWLRDFLHELGQDKFMHKPCTIFADNMGAICIADSNAINDRSKHINVKYHYNRELMENGEIKFVYLRSNENVADLLTKSLTGPKTKDFAHKLGIYMYRDKSLYCH